MIVPRAYYSLPAALYLAFFFSLQFSHATFFIPLHALPPVLPHHTPLLHLNAFGSVVPPPYCAKVCFLTALCHLSLLRLLMPSLHFRIYIFFSSSCARHLFRTYVSAVSNERAQMRYVVLAMSHKETGSAALSYRCSHKHRRLNERSSTILLHANPIVLGEESVSNSMTRSPTPVAAPTSSLSALLAVCRSARWRLAVEGRRGLDVVLNPLCGSVQAAICESCLVNRLLPSIFHGQTRSSEGTPLWCHKWCWCLSDFAIQTEFKN